jgi:hypothetical protein
MIHAISEFEFHISPARSSSRPQTGTGTMAATSSTCAATPGSLVRRIDPPTAASRSGMSPSRQQRTS